MSIEQVKKGDELTQSLDIINENIARLKELFPEVLTEGKIDFKVLQDILGKEIEEEDEYYRFTWAGKAQARREAHKPSTGTLRPAKEESVNWDTTQNLYIEGDNLEVLKLLQKSYTGKVKMIYIDPPYNTGNDFVYKDNYTDNLKNYQQISGQIDDEGNKLFTNSESDGRYHSNWLNMMYPRLNLARNLLTDDGVIFISIDDNEFNNLIKMCDEVFGENNFVANFIWKSRQNKDNRTTTGASIDHEYILCYSKNNESKALKGSDRKVEQYNNPDSDPRGNWASANMVGILDENLRPNCHYDLINHHTGINYGKPKMGWRYDIHTMNRLIEEDRIIWPSSSEGRPRRKVFLNELSDSFAGFSSVIGQNIYTKNGTKEIDDLFSYRAFDFPKPISLITLLIEQVAKNDDIILDFFSGSATTAHTITEINAKNNSNLKYILVQIPEMLLEKSEAYKSGYKSISDIGRERIRRAGKKIITDKLAEIEKLKLKSSLLIEDLEEIENLTEAINNLDIGFKTFKLDSSNIKGWDGNPDNLVDSLFDSQDNIKTGRTEEDVLFEILLKYGLDLTLPIEEKLIEGKKVFTVGFGALFICLANGITNNVAEGIGQWKEELNPETCRVIFKDSGFGDVEKANSVQTLKRFGIHEIKSI